MPEDYSLETVFCALMYLMSKQAQNPELELQPAILDHLGKLTDHPHIKHFPHLEDTSSRLVLHWAGASGNPLGDVPSSTRIN